jgi:hypothetical protein
VYMQRGTLRLSPTPRNSAAKLHTLLDQHYCRTIYSLLKVN